MTGRFSAVVFAHNVADQIETCLRSIFACHGDTEVFVIANGCGDATEDVIAGLKSRYPKLQLVSLALADKANAWNHYVHHLAPSADMHFFIDADIRLAPDALHRLYASYQAQPGANVIGGVPMDGRDRSGWVARMRQYGRVSGALYGVPHGFVTRMRVDNLRLPAGLIGEDFLVSALAKDPRNFQSFFMPSPRVIIEPQAGFRFDPMSYRRIRDYYAYLRRLIRYRIRGHQLMMLLDYCASDGAAAMPDTVVALYLAHRDRLRYGWRGKATPIDWLAVYQMRRQLARHRQTTPHSANLPGE